MKHKRRRGASPLSQYRRLQREIRELYDPFTTRHCAGCAAPCCVKPTRVTPIDVALALEIGHTFPHLGVEDPFAPALEYAARRLAPSAVTLPMANGSAPTEFCEFLHRGRCTFPDDLRPFGCTQYVCGPMDAHFPSDTLHRLRHLLRRLEDTHNDLLRALDDDGAGPESEPAAALAGFHAPGNK